MNNVYIARQLLKIAKLIISYQHQTQYIGPFILSVKRLKLGKMEHYGDFICVDGKYTQLINIKQQLKKKGFTWDNQHKLWCGFWKTTNWEEIKQILYKHANVQPNKFFGYKQGQKFSKRLKLKRIEQPFKSILYGKVIFRRKFIFEDQEGVQISSFIVNKKKYYNCCDKFWNKNGDDFNQKLQFLKEKKFLVEGQITQINNNDILFNLG